MLSQSAMERGAARPGAGPEQDEEERGGGEGRGAWGSGDAGRHGARREFAPRPGLDKTRGMRRRQGEASLPGRRRQASASGRCIQRIRGMRGSTQASPSTM
jgi:hypothetical protein